MKFAQPHADTGAKAALERIMRSALARRCGPAPAIAATIGLALGTGLFGAGLFEAGLFEAGLARAQPASDSAPDTASDSDNGRYTMAPAADGFIRLDTRTGEVSTCHSKGGWICRVAPDERAALDAEIGRLQRENEALKAQLAERGGTITGKIDEPLAKEDLQKPRAPSRTPDRDVAAESPSDQDRLLAVLERVWQRLVDMAARVQKQLSEKI